MLDEPCCKCICHILSMFWLSVGSLIVSCFLFLVCVCVCVCTYMSYVCIICSGRIHPMTAHALLGLAKTFANMSQWEKMHQCASDAQWIHEQLSHVSRDDADAQPQVDDGYSKEEYHTCEKEIAMCLKVHPYRFRALHAKAVALGRQGSGTIMDGIQMTTNIIHLMQEHHLDWTQLYQDSLFELETLSFRAKSILRFPIHGDEEYDLIKEGAAPIKEHTHEYFKQRTTR